MELSKELLEQLIDSHFDLFRRLNQLNNRNPNKLNAKALENAAKLNRLLANQSEPKIIQSNSLP